MFKTIQEASRKRALIASANMEDRRRIGEITKAAELRAVGFIREAEQIGPRILLSMPDVLLLDYEMFRGMQEPRVQMQELRNNLAIKVVLFGKGLGMTTVQACKRDGIDGTLDLESESEDFSKYARLLRNAIGEQPAAPAPVAPVPVAAPPIPAIRATRKIQQPASVVIGSSTGGPVALMALLKQLPRDFPLPIAVVQHMPPTFTHMLAERLNAECALNVVEAEAGMAFSPGTVHIAPGGFHMVLAGTPKSPSIELNTANPENSCRPAVDVLFRSSAAVYGGRQHAIVLTGMGRDGLLGAMQLHSLGSRIVVQDVATSTVWGMPGAIAQAGYADEVLPIDQIGPQLLRCL